MKAIVLYAHERVNALSRTKTQNPGQTKVRREKLLCTNKHTLPEKPKKKQSIMYSSFKEYDGSNNHNVARREQKNGDVFREYGYC